MKYMEYVYVDMHNFDTGGRNMMPKAGLRKEHTNGVDLMNSLGGRNGESTMMEGDLSSNGFSYLFPT